MDVANGYGSVITPPASTQPQHPPPSYSASSSQTSTTSSKESTRSFPESDIMKIVSSGFTRSEAIEELEKCNGNADVALIQLLGRTIHF